MRLLLKDPGWTHAASTSDEWLPRRNTALTATGCGCAGQARGAGAIHRTQAAGACSAPACSAPARSAPAAPLVAPGGSPAGAPSPAPVLVPPSPAWQPQRPRKQPRPAPSSQYSPAGVYHPRAPALPDGSCSWSNNIAKGDKRLKLQCQHCGERFKCAFQTSRVPFALY